MKKIYRIYSREHSTTLGFAANEIAAQKLKLKFETEFFEEWNQKTFPKIKKNMELSFRNMCKGNEVVFQGNVENPGDTFGNFKINIFNDKKYDDETGAECKHTDECDCTYKTKNSIEIQIVEMFEEEDF